jgi:hypothetical protein
MTKAQLIKLLENIPDNEIVNVWVPTEVTGSNCHDDFDGFAIVDVAQDSPAGIIIGSEMLLPEVEQ